MECGIVHGVAPRGPASALHNSIILFVEQKRDGRCNTCPRQWCALLASSQQSRCALMVALSARQFVYAACVFNPRISFVRVSPTFLLECSPAREISLPIEISALRLVIFLV
jgi:hypothetical protein